MSDPTSTRRRRGARPAEARRRRRRPSARAADVPRRARRAAHHRRRARAALPRLAGLVEQPRARRTADQRRQRAEPAVARPGDDEPDPSADADADPRIDRRRLRSARRHGAQPADYQPFAVLYIPRFGADWKRTIRQTVDTEKVLNSYDAGRRPLPGHPAARRGRQLRGRRARQRMGQHVHRPVQAAHRRPHLRADAKTAGTPTRFRNFEYVQPTAVEVHRPGAAAADATPADRLITLTTCNPPFHAGERLIAYSVFDGLRSRRRQVAGRDRGAPSRRTEG